MDDDVEVLVDRFVEAGIFERAGDQGLRLTDAFEETREEHRERVEALDDDEFEATVERYAGDSAVDEAEVDRRTLGDAMALFRSTDSIDRRRCLTGAVALGTLEGTADQDLPDGFLALDGEDVEQFIEHNSAAAVYFWREDCGPCSAVEEHFEELLEADEIPERVALGAVYGPDCVQLIRERFDVTVAPTVLFCSNGSIESRLVGNKGPERLRTEIQRL